MTMDLTQYDLTEFALFQGVDTETARLFLNMGFRFHYEAGTPLVVNNDLGETFFVLLSGMAKLVLVNNRKKEVNVTLFRAGDFFGELSMLEPKPLRTANVIAVTPVEVVAIQKKEFQKMMLQHPAMALNIARVLGQRLRAMNERMVTERMPDEQKVLQTLLSMSRKGRQIETESTTILLPQLSLKEWAAFCYVKPDVFLAVMEKYRRSGVLEFSAQRIAITNLEGMRIQLERLAMAYDLQRQTEEAAETPEDDYAATSEYRYKAG